MCFHLQVHESEKRYVAFLSRSHYREFVTLIEAGGSVEDYVKENEGFFLDWEIKALEAAAQEIRKQPQLAEAE